MKCRLFTHLAEHGSEYAAPEPELEPAADEPGAHEEDLQQERCVSKASSYSYHAVQLIVRRPVVQHSAYWLKCWLMVVCMQS